MTTLEHEVIEKFHQLDREAQQRVRQIIIQDTSTQNAFDFDVWSREIESVRQDIRDSYGGQHPEINVVDMLRNIRDGEDE